MARMSPTRIAAVVRAEPAWDAVPATVSPALRTLLQRCLVKDPRERLGDASTALYVLKEAASLAGVYPPFAPIDSAVVSDRRTFARFANGRFLVAAAVMLLAAGGVGAVAAWLATRPAPPRVRKQQVIAVGVSPTAPGRTHLAISPDGSRIVYLNGDGIVVHPLDQLDPLPPIPASAASRPFVSPDGQSIGFFDNSRGS